MEIHPEVNVALTDMKLSEVQHFFMAVHEMVWANKLMDPLHDLEVTSLAMAGQAGKFANNIKKVRRDEIDLLTPTPHVVEHLAELRGEAADTFTYLIVVASLLGMSLQDFLDLAVSRTTAWAEARGLDLHGVAAKGGLLFKYVIPFHTQDPNTPPPSVVPEDRDPS